MRHTGAHIRFASTAKVYRVLFTGAQSEICQDDSGTGVGQKNIIWLEVAVIDPFVVALLDCLENIVADASGMRVVPIHAEVALQRRTKIALGVIVL